MDIVRRKFILVTLALKGLKQDWLVFLNYQNSYLATRLGGTMQKKGPINKSLDLNAISFVLNTN